MHLQPVSLNIYLQNTSKMNEELYFSTPIIQNSPN